MSKSIMMKDKVCYVCGQRGGLHKHHIFYGTGNRKLSEKYGCWCYLCYSHHNIGDQAVHFNKELDLKLKKQCQIRWEMKNGTREEFIRTFGRNYL